MPSASKGTQAGDRPPRRPRRGFPGVSLAALAALECSITLLSLSPKRLTSKAEGASRGRSLSGAE